MADYSSFAAIANEATVTELFKLSTYESFVTSILPTQRMSASRVKTPVRAKATPASWVGADHRKAYQKYTVGAKFLIADELAQVTAVPEEDFMDQDLDVVEEMQRLGGESIAMGLDQTVANGPVPPAWASTFTPIVPGATAVGNTVESTGDLAADLKAAAAKLASNGFKVTNFIYNGDVSEFWGLTNGDLSTPLLTGDSNANYRVNGKPIFFLAEGVFPEIAKIGALDAPHFAIGVREDATFKQTDVGTIIAGASGANGTLKPEDIISGFQDDTVLFRVKARFGAAHSGDATHYPAAIVTVSESV